EAPRLEPLDQELRRRAVARETRLEAFGEHALERGVQPVDHRDRRGVVVDAARAEIPADQREVEIPALNRARAALEPRPRGRSERDRRETRRTGETLLGAGVGRVDLPLVEAHVDARE